MCDPGSDNDDGKSPSCRGWWDDKTQASGNTDTKVLPMSVAGTQTRVPVRQQVFVNKNSQPMLQIHGSNQMKSANLVPSVFQNVPSQRIPLVITHPGVPVPIAPTGVSWIVL